MKPAATMPLMIAIMVPSSRTPLPHESRFSGSSSGRIPYFAGPKKALCTPMRKTHPSCKGRLCRASANTASSITPISNVFTAMATCRLLCCTASWPAAIENRMNGIANRKVASDSSVCLRPTSCA
jgi:hypothetical protein